ncbi:MAG TPA: lysophospholipid acyltransferase family protein [Sunxiuqinia sp.]|nr:lysophospholipid acyltransferase family protein [Sunxiuqinia sp.]
MGKIFRNLMVLFLKAFSYLPFSVIYLISDFLYFLLVHVIGYRKKVVYTNLKNSFPEKSDDEIDKIARKFYHHLCDMGLESIKLHSISEKELDKRLTVKGLEKTNDYSKQKKSIILLGMHYNNWEWSASLQRLSGHQLLMIYNPVRNNIEMERFILDMRERFGGMSVPVHKSARSAIQFDKTDRPGCLWLAADQTPFQTSKFWTIFLNQETPFFSGPEKIAYKTNQPVFFHHTKKLARGKYEVNFIELFAEPGKEKPEDILLTYIDTMEQIIRETPQYWLWSHRRWKHKRSEDVELIERLPKSNA